MTRKVHLRRSKIVDGKTPLASCASRAAGAGKCNSNGRATYRFMASEVVGFDAFLASDNQCQHCLDTGLGWINAQARRDGIAEFADWAAFAAFRAARRAAKFAE